jgi:hypothetical protein
MQRQGVGRAMLNFALRRSLDLSHQSGSVVVIVDTIDDDARAFYGSARFKLLPASVPVERKCATCEAPIPEVESDDRSPYDTTRMWVAMETVKVAVQALAQ